LLLTGSLLLGRLLILRLIQPEYLAALPVFYVLIIAVWLMLVFLVFRPLAVSLDLLRWHNLALLTSAAVVIVLIVAGELNAMTMALIQLGEVVILRSLFCGLVWTRLDRLDRLVEKG
jgi:O-antigen/teichoic acid export membrane protein